MIGEQLWIDAFVTVQFAIDWHDAAASEIVDPSGSPHQHQLIERASILFEEHQIQAVFSQWPLANDFGPHNVIGVFMVSAGQVYFDEHLVAVRVY